MSQWWISFMPIYSTGCKNSLFGLWGPKRGWNFKHGSLVKNQYVHNRTFVIKWDLRPWGGLNLPISNFFQPISLLPNRRSRGFPPIPLLLLPFLSKSPTFHFICCPISQISHFFFQSPSFQIPHWVPQKYLGTKSFIFPNCPQSSILWVLGRLGLIFFERY
jgi:hypothetical protein